MSTKPRVSIVMGSDSDLDIMRESAKALEEFDMRSTSLPRIVRRNAPRNSRARQPRAESA